MKVIKFIMLYQFFDAQEIKLKNRLIALQSIPVDKMSKEDLEELLEVKIKLSYLKNIYCNLTEFLIDL